MRRLNGFVSPGTGPRARGAAQVFQGLKGCLLSDTFADEGSPKGDVAVQEAQREQG